MTLLALVLAIGLVVDDAIVVVENIYRHIEEGKRPMEAALLGAREIVYPIIAMTITLAAVFAPIGFVSGLTGALFKEFAFTLAGAVHGVRHDRAHALADDVLAAVEGAEKAGRGPLHRLARPHVRRAQAALSAPACTARSTTGR